MKDKFFASACMCVWELQKWKEIMERVNQRTNHLLGMNIKKLRIEKRLRNRDIVAQLQVRGVEISTGTYSKVEMGLNNPSVDLLIALTDILGCDFNAFFEKY